MWEFDCKRLDTIQIYACTVCTVICRHAYVLGLFCLFLCFASQLLRHADSLLFLFFLSLAVDHVQFLVLPLSDIVTSCCAPAIYILASWWFMRCTFVRESQDSPGSNLPIQDRFRKKVLWKCIEICLTYYDNLFNHFACKDLCYELMPKCCGGWDYSTDPL